MGLFKKKKSDSALTTEQARAASTVRVSGKKTRPGREKKKNIVKEDRHYTALSNFFRHTEWICICLAIIVGVVMSFIFSDEITTENLGLLFRGVSFTFPGENTAFETVRYDADRQMDFETFREYFAVATSTNLRLYDHRGNIAFEKDFSMKNPTVSSGREYVMVYDREGKEYIICNAIAAVHSGKSENTLYLAGINENGSYYTCSSAPDHLSVIEVYNRNFNKRRELKLDRYPLSIDMSDNGDRMLFLSYGTAENGLVAGTVTVYDMTDKTTVLFEKNYDTLPLYGALLPTGKAAVVFEEGIRFYDEQGSECGYMPFESGTPVKVTMSKGLVAVSFDENKVLGENKIEIYDAEAGQRLEIIDYTGRISAMHLLEEKLFISEEDQTAVYHCREKKMMILEIPLPQKAIAGEQNALFFCYGNKAENMGTQIEKYFND